MAKFRVLAEMTILLEHEIEADSLEQAWELAKQADGGDFTVMDETHQTDGWDIYDVQEVTE